jgi:tetratricopeptide (TPR) repeat protein
MSTRPIIFLSAVSKELHNARDLVAKTLLALGYEPKWQDIAPTETGDLRCVLRKWVDDSAAVLQLVGHCYGFAPKDADPDFGPCSYTQYEALYARQQGRPVYYLFIDESHPTDGCGCEPRTLHNLQENYRQNVKSYGALYHSTSSLVQTELLVRRLKDDLAALRTRGKQYAALVLGLLMVLVLGGVWMMRRQSDSAQMLAALSQQNKELKEGQADLRQMFETSIKGGSEAKLTADYDSALRFISHRRGLGLETFRTFLDKNATHALDDVAVSMKDKVRALQEAGQFVQARDFALKQARRLASERRESIKEEVELWTEAAKTEITLGHYATALEHVGKALSLISPKPDFLTWSAARHQQGRALSYLRRDKEAQALYEDLIPLQQASLGPDHPTILQSRRTMAISIWDQGNYALAEQLGRALVADCQRVFGAEHPFTLASRMDVANALDAQGKHAEAEQEHRSVLQSKKRVLGEEHPDTLASRNNLAIALDNQGKHAEAQQEYRAVLEIKDRVLGAEHPETLSGRMNVANALNTQGKHYEAMQEHLAVLQIQVRVLGAEHPSTLKSRMGLANALAIQGKYAEAELEYRTVLNLQQRVLSAEHPETLSSRMNLALALDAQDKHSEAEQEYRAVLQIQERVLGAEHPDVAMTCYNMALCLEHSQQKLPEAFALMQRAEQVWTKHLGLAHPHTKLAKTVCDRLEAALK